MVYLILAIFSSAMVSILMRLSEGKIQYNLGMLAVNYGMCALLGAWNAQLQAGLPGLTATGIFGGINGVLYLVSFVLFQENVRRSGVVLPATFMKLGLLVTMVVSVCIYGEIPGIWETLGFVLAVVAIVLINYNKEGGASKFRFGLVALLLCGGMADAMSKIFEESGPAGMGDSFLFFTFATALVLCILWMVRKGQRAGKRELVFGLLVGIPNFYSSRFLLGALARISAVIAYPAYSVGTILVVTVSGMLFFRERLTKRQGVALALILAALVLLNV